VTQLPKTPVMRHVGGSRKAALLSVGLLLAALLSATLGSAPVGASSVLDLLGTTTTTKPKTTTTTIPTGPPKRTAMAKTATLHSSPVGLAAGDYQVTVTGLTSSTPTYGEIDQQIGGTGKLLRTADFLAGPTPQTVTAEVRIAGPTDLLAPVTSTIPVSWTSITYTPASYSFVARGAAITKPDGTTAVLHGVQGALDMAAGDYVALWDYYPKVNEFRISVNEECWDSYFTAAQSSGTCDRYDNQTGLTGAAAYQAWVQQSINTVIAAGRTVILTVDIAGRDDPTWIPPTQNDRFGPDQQTLVVYDQLAQIYGNNPSVIFETTNEPKMSVYSNYPPNNTPGADLWRLGGMVTVGSQTWNLPGVQTLADRLRADGINNLILLNGPAFASNLTPIGPNPILGTNLALAYHAYRSPDNQQTYPPSLNWAVGPYVDPAGSYRYAALLTEFATGQSDLFGAASKYLVSVINFAKAHGDGWDAFGWQPIAWNQFGLLNSYDPFSVNSKGKTVGAKF
jgi:hypothetical protein